MPSVGRLKVNPLSEDCPPSAGAATLEMLDTSSNASVPLRTVLKCIMSLAVKSVGLMRLSKLEWRKRPRAHSRTRDFGQILFQAVACEKGGPGAAFRFAMLYFCRRRSASGAGAG